MAVANLGLTVQTSPMEALIRTKLFVPPAHCVCVRRPQLIERLGGALEVPLTLVSAPAGFGKTTLLSEWAAEAYASIAWISLDEGDNDPRGFATYLAAALSTVGIDLDEEVPSTLNGARTPLEGLMVAVINRVFEFSGDIILVLDNFHALTDSEIHEALEFLLEHQPAQLHLVLLTRADPPLPLARYRLKGQLLEFRAQDLRFSTDEISAFINQKLGLSLSEEEITRLESRTGGWVAALQMASVFLQNETGLGDFLDAFSGKNRYITDYLYEEFFTVLPAEVQDFLLQTSILPALNSSLCDAVRGMGQPGPDTRVSFPENPMRTGQVAESGEILEELERRNLFIEPLDSTRCWYRYNRLFAEFLHSRLAGLRPDFVPVLHQRASQWYEENGYPDEAIDQSLAGGDFQRAANLVDRQAQAMFACGQALKVLSWLDAFPDGLVGSRSQLRFHKAWALLSLGRLDEVVLSLPDGLALAGEPPKQSSPPEDEVLPGALAALQAGLALHRKPPAVVLEYCQAVLDSEKVLDRKFRSAIWLVQGLAARGCGEYDKAREAWLESQALAAQDDDEHTAFQALAELAQLYRDLGEPQKAEALLQEGLHQAQQSIGSPSPAAAILYVGLGDLFREWGAYEQAAGYLREALAMANQCGSARAALLGYLSLARTLCARGDPRAADQVLARCAALPSGAGLPWEWSQVQAFQAQLQLSMDKRRPADRWFDSRQASSADHGAAGTGLEGLIAAQVLAARGHVPQALDLLEGLEGTAQEAGRMGELIRILALKASLLLADRRVEQALGLLEKMLDYPVLPYYRGAFLESVPSLRPQLEALRGPSDRIVKNFAPVLNFLAGKKPVQKAGNGNAANIPGHPQGPKEDLAGEKEALSQRELQILRLLAAGLSNKEIAAELIVATSTVHWHTKNIYRKLKVNSRMQASLRAQELDLL